MVARSVRERRSSLDHVSRDHVSPVLLTTASCVSGPPGAAGAHAQFPVVTGHSRGSECSWWVRLGERGDPLMRTSVPVMTTRHRPVLERSVHHQHQVLQTLDSNGYEHN